MKGLQGVEVMSDHIKRPRSPNYPAISLPTALGQLRTLYDRIERHAAPKEAVLKGLGFSGWNGSSATALSAHIKFGILERLSEDSFKITPLGMTLLFHESPAEYATAIDQAARMPTLFAELLSEFSGSVPHEDILRPRLIRRGFAQSAVGTVISAFRETMEFVTANPVGYNSPVQKPVETPVQQQPAIQTAKPPPMSQQAAQQVLREEEPYRVSLTRGAIEVAARLQDEGSANELIEALQAWKLLLRKMPTPKIADEAED